jgi:3-oxoacyl-[acyl-carrier protein] reductase
MPETIAIVTGGLRGLGRAMTLGLLKQGHRVAAVGHIREDIAEITALADGTAASLLTLIAELRVPAECDRVFTESRTWFGGDPGILVNNAGLTFTFIDPTQFRRKTP